MIVSSPLQLCTTIMTVVRQLALLRDVDLRRQLYVGARRAPGRPTGPPASALRADDRPFGQGLIAHGSQRNTLPFIPNPNSTRSRLQTRPQNQPRTRFSNPTLPTSNSRSPTPNPTPNPTTRIRPQTRSDTDLAPDSGINHLVDLGSWPVLFKCLLGGLKRIILWALSSDPHPKTIHTRR